MRLVAFFVGLIATVVIACSSHENIGTTTDDLNGIVLSTFTNVPGGTLPDRNHFATTSTVTIADPSCGGLGNGFRTAAVWEEETWGSSDTPVATWFGSECAFNPPSLYNGGSAQQLTSAAYPAGTGTPANWSTLFGGGTMVWTKEPTLVPVTDPTQPGAIIALVGLVGPSPQVSAEIALQLSFDGGRTWGSSSVLPFLLLGTPANNLNDLAVTAGTHVDVTGGSYRGKFNSQTYDIYLTWWRNGQRFFDVASYDNHTGAWQLDHLSAPVLLDNVTAINPTGGLSGITFMSIVSGLATTPPHEYPFVAVQWPSPQAHGAHPPTVQCPNTGSNPNWVWKGAASWDYGTTWHAIADSHPAVKPWPYCVGSSGSPPFRNQPRSSLTFEPNTGTVIDAVAVPDTIDSVPGTYIEANAFDFHGALTYPAVAQPVFHTTHATGLPVQDQFMPTIAADPNLTGKGQVTLVYVDSLQDQTKLNVPSGLYGTSTTNFTIAAPNFVSTRRVWPVPPAPQAIMWALGVDYDNFGRHNSIGVDGWSWLTFAGDNTHTSGGAPYESMDILSLDPTF